MTIIRLLALGAALSAGCSNQNETIWHPDMVERAADMTARAGDLTQVAHDMTAARQTTIANARGNFVSGPILVTAAVVTAVRDSSNWYIEDLAGGPNSGVAVYSNSPGITPPALHDLVTVTGALQTYEGKVELAPTAEQTITGNVPDPAAVTVQPADLDPSGKSNLRGVLVQLAVQLTVDSVLPQKLYDTSCGKGDAGAGALCHGCKPPTYSGFQANDGAGHEVLIEDYFYNTENLQSSPECLTQPGAVPVKVGQTFSMIRGILELDTYGSVQVLEPITDMDYTTP